MSKGTEKKPIITTGTCRKPRLTMGERFKDARLVHNQHGKETTGAVEKATGVCKSTLSQIENDKRDPGAKTVSELAKHYGVSADYLLGLSEVITPDATAQAVIAYTGLSEDNVRTLHNAAESSGGTIIAEEEDRQLTFDGNKPFLDCLNDLLDAVFYDRETIIKHYIRLRRTTMKSDSIDLWYLMGQPTPIIGFEPRRYSDHSAQFAIDNELVEYDCLKIAKEIEEYLKGKYIAGQNDLNRILEDE